MTFYSPFNSFFATCACAAILSGCATAPPAPLPAPPALATLLAQADAALTAKQEVRAIAILKQASTLYPSDKNVWLRLAQVSFDCERYGDSITFAHAVLERDANDTKANSMAAVSGLRVSSQALRELAQKNNVSGPVRTEAQQLAKLLRTSIGGDIIAPPKRLAVKPPPVRTAVPVPVEANDPFRLLRLLERNESGAK